jgi:glycosyltransferase involved in cell wall biosynthesis
MVDILLSVYNGMPHLPEQVESLRAQTYPDWRLWVRDDGSTDGSADAIREMAAADGRVRLLDAGGDNLGAARSYAWLMARPEVDAEHVMLCDADDFWLADKIEITLEAMRSRTAEAAPGTPVLVHTDLIVADARLRPVADSFWRYRALAVEPATLRRLLSRNVVTGPTMMLNRPLLEVAGAAPRGAIYQDWWITLVAAAFGIIVAVPRPTVLYRQHGRNSVGARPAGRALDLAKRALKGAAGEATLRDELRRAAGQAAAFLDRYRDRLSEDDRALLERFAGIASAGPIARRLRVHELASVPEHGIVRNLARALRS